METLNGTVQTIIKFVAEGGGSTGIGGGGTGGSGTSGASTFGAVSNAVKTAGGTGDMLTVFAIALAILAVVAALIYLMAKNSAKASAASSAANSPASNTGVLAKSTKIAAIILAALTALSVCGLIVFNTLKGTTAQASEVVAPDVIEAIVHDDGSISIPNISINNPSTQTAVQINGAMSSLVGSDISSTKWTFKCGDESKSLNLDGTQKLDSFLDASETKTYAISLSGMSDDTAKSLIGKEVVKLTCTPENAYKINYAVASSSANMGSVNPAFAYVTEETAQATTSTATENAGYSFYNWTDENGNEVDKNSTFASKKSADGMSNATYYANFITSDPSKYTVIFNANGGTGIMDNQIIPVDVDAQLDKCTFTPPEGCLFDKWIDSAGNVYSDQQAIKDLAAARGSITLTAQWATATEEAYACWDGSTLTFCYDNQRAVRTAAGNTCYDLNTESNEPAWVTDTTTNVPANCKDVVFSNNFYNYTPTTCAYWFEGFSNLAMISAKFTPIDFSNLNGTEITNMEGMFKGSKLGDSTKRYAIDLRPLSGSTNNVTNRKSMFENCSTLMSVWIDDSDVRGLEHAENMFAMPDKENVLSAIAWNKNLITDCPNLTTGDTGTSTGMFNNCVNLPKWDESVAKHPEQYVIDKTYAYLDDGQAGLFVSSDASSASTSQQDNFAQKNGGTPYVCYNNTSEPQGWEGGPRTLKPNELAFFYDGHFGEWALLCDCFAMNTSEDPLWLKYGSSCTKITVDDSFSNFSAKTCYKWFKDFNNSELKSIDISKIQLDTSEPSGYTRSAYEMFKGCSNVSSITFSDNFDTSAFVDMDYMFYECKSLQHLDLSFLKTQNVKRMYFMFGGCENLTDLNLSGNFSVASVEDAKYMFYYCEKLNVIYCDNNWNQQATKSTIQSDYMFGGCSSLPHWDTDGSEGSSTLDKTYAYPDDGTHGFFNSKTNPTPYAVYNPTDNDITIGTQTVAKHGLLFFYDNNKLNWVKAGCRSYAMNTSTAPAWVKDDVNNVPQNCVSVSFDSSFASWTTKTCYSWFNGFNNADFKTIDLTNLKLNTTVPTETPEFENSTAEMFKNCSSLTGITFGTNFATSAVSNMQSMFNGCSALSTLDVSKLSTANATDLSYLFAGCSAFETLDVTTLDTSNATTVAGMFKGCSKLTSLDVDNFAVDNWVATDEMFSGCSALATIYCDKNWSTSSTLTSSTDMFAGDNNLPHFDSTKVDKTYAYPDNSTTGYFKPKSTTAEFYAVFNTEAETGKVANTLSFYYDANKPTTGGTKTVYDNLPTTTATKAGDWLYHEKATAVANVVIDQSVKNYHDLTSTAGMLGADNSSATSESEENTTSGFINANSISGCDNLDVSKVTNMASMFEDFGASSTTISTVPKVTDWDTSKVTDMSSLFNSYASSCTSFNQVPNVANWNTAACTNMSALFYCYAKSSNSISSVPDVSNWDTSSVADMSGLFAAYAYSNTAFNIVPNVLNWNTSNVDDMSNLFAYYASSSTSLSSVPDVKKWDTSNVTNMSDLFNEYAFSSTSVTSVPDVASWDTSNVTNMSSLFKSYAYSSTTFNAVPAVGNWDTSSCENMSAMFSQYNGFMITGASTRKINVVPNVATKQVTVSGKTYIAWDTSKVTDMSKMFYQYAYNSTQLSTVPDVSKWDTSSLENISYLFAEYAMYRQITVVPDVATKKVTIGENTYTAWNTSKIVNMEKLFLSYASQTLTTLASLDLSGWDISSVENTKQMLCQYGMNQKVWAGASPIVYGTDWNTKKPSITNADNMFAESDLKGNTSGNWSSANTSDTGCFTAKPASTEFYAVYTASTEDSNATNTLTFYYDKNKELKTGDIFDAWPTNPTKLSDWPYHEKASSVNKVVFDSSVASYTGLTSTAWMFGAEDGAIEIFANASSITGCENLNVSNVTNMTSMFRNFGSAVTTITTVPNVSSWATSKVTDMSYTFASYAASSTSKLSELNLAYWKITALTNTSSMFYKYGAAQSESDRPVVYGTDWNTTKESGVTATDMFTNSKLRNAPTTEGSDQWSYANTDETTGCFTVKPVSDEFYAVLDNNILNFYYDGAKESKTTGTVYDNLPTEATAASQWPYHNDAANVTSVIIDPSVSGYHDLKSTAGMFGGDSSSEQTYFKNASSISGCTYLDVSNVTNMADTFRNFGRESTSIAAPPDVANWDTSKVTDMSWMFYSYGLSSTSLTSVPNVSSWNTQSCKNMYRLFSQYAATTSHNAVPDVSKWDTSSVENMCEMFHNYGYAVGSTFNSVPDVATKQVTVGEKTYTAWDTSNVTNMSGLFFGYGHQSSVINQVPNVSDWDTSNVTNMSGLFSFYANRSSAINKVPDVSRWDTSKVTNMSSLFSYYAQYTKSTIAYLDLSRWNITSVENTKSMFEYYNQNQDATSVIYANNWTDKKSSIANSTNMFWVANVRNYYKSESANQWVSADTASDGCFTAKPVINEFYAVYTEATEDSDTANTLSFYYDDQAGSRAGRVFYDLPTSATKAENWPYYKIASNVTNVVIDESVANYAGLSSTAWMFGAQDGAAYTFANASNISGCEYLNVGNVTNMASMFQNFGSAVTTLTAVPNVSTWNTSKVTNMINVFASYGKASTSDFAPLDLLDWDISSVTNASNMFYQYGTNQSKTPVVYGTDWSDKTGVDAIDMFTYSKLRNAPTTERVDQWNLANTSATGCFTADPTEFYAVYTDSTNTLSLYYDKNKATRSGDKYGPLPNDATSLSNWPYYEKANSVTSVVIDSSVAKYHELSSTAGMFGANDESSEKFANATSITGCENLDVSNVTNMTSMFQNFGSAVSSLSVVPDVSNWSTSKVTNMSYLFASYGKTSTTTLHSLSLTNWSIGSLTNTSYMFNAYGAANSTSNRPIVFAKDWTSIKSSSQVTATGMFTSSALKGKTTGDWDSAHTGETGCFTGLEFYAVLDNNVLTFYYDGNKTTRTTGTKYENLPTNAQAASDWPYHSNMSSITSVVIDSSVAKFHDLTSTAYMFGGGTSDGYLSSAQSIYGCENLDVSHVTNMYSMFQRFGMNTNVTNVPDVSKWDTSSCTNMQGMFFRYASYEYQTSFNQVPNVSDWDISNVTNLAYIFCNFALYSTNCNVVPDVSKWDTSKVTTMNRVFSGFAQRSSVMTAVPDVGNWDTSQVTDMTQLFCAWGSGRRYFNAVPNVSNWDTSKVKKMNLLFCEYGINAFNGLSALDLSKWDISSVEETTSMFDGYAQQSNYYCTVYGTNWSETKTSVSNSDDMFCNSALKNAPKGTGSQWWRANTGSSGCFTAKTSNETTDDANSSSVLDEADKTNSASQGESTIRDTDNSEVMAEETSSTSDDTVYAYADDNGEEGDNANTGNDADSSGNADSTKNTASAVRDLDMDNATTNGVDGGSTPDSNGNAFNGAETIFSWLKSCFASIL